jgi:AraC-like DNA-binding protein
MTGPIPKATLPPPAGRPNWIGGRDLPLLYLGWGQRDFAKNPLPMHYDLGTNYYLLLRGQIVLITSGSRQIIRGPTAMIFDPDQAFSLSQAEPGNVEILVWIWQGRPQLPEIRPAPASHLIRPLPPRSLKSLTDLHTRCRNEVAHADARLPLTLDALRTLFEVELVRATQPVAAADDVRWGLATAWMAGNLALHAPVPSLCDYLGMSGSTLHRFFVKRCGHSPGTYFRNLKLTEARRLIQSEGWQVKATAFHLGYRHPNDLSRALANHPAPRFTGRSSG